MLIGPCTEGCRPGVIAISRSAGLEPRLLVIVAAHLTNGWRMPSRSHQYIQERRTGASTFGAFGCTSHQWLKDAVQESPLSRRAARGTQLLAIVAALLTCSCLEDPDLEDRAEKLKHVWATKAVLGLSASRAHAKADQDRSTLWVLLPGKG